MSITVISPFINPMALSSQTGSNQTKNLIKGLRLGICAILALILLVMGYLFWLQLGYRDSKTDSIVRTVPVPLPGPGVVVSPAQSTAEQGNSPSVPPPLAVDPSGTVQAIRDRGQALQKENRKIRDSLAAGDLSALPDSLKVADLPLDTPPPKSVPPSSRR
jgi:hypothetical protein